MDSAVFNYYVEQLCLALQHIHLQRHHYNMISTHNTITHTV